MTLYTDLFPDKPNLLARKFWNEYAGSPTYTIPAGAAYIRVHAMGAGSMSTEGAADGAYARAKVAVTPGQVLTIYVGIAGSGPSGDSYVSRSGTNLVYADRGRAAGSIPGQASNCIGDVKRDGNASPNGDSAEYGTCNFTNNRHDFAGQKGYMGISNHGDFYAQVLGNNGQVCVEVFDKDPGY